MSYQSDLDEHIDDNLEEDIYHHGIARDTNNPNAYPSRDERLCEYVQQLMDGMEKGNE